MAEITSRRSKIPEFAAFPVKKSTLDEYLHSSREESMQVLFMGWSTKPRAPGNTNVLSARFSASEERWVIWIYPVRKTELQLIKAALIPDGLVRLQEWLSEQAGYIGSNSREPGWFEIAFDGKELIFTG
jgi:hypothetical protein